MTTSLSGWRLLVSLGVVYGMLAILVADSIGEWLAMLACLYATFFVLFGMLSFATRDRS